MHWEHLSALTIHLREFSQDIRKKAKMVISFWGWFMEINYFQNMVLG